MEFHLSLPGTVHLFEFCTIDFNNAFIQAKLDAPVWIHLPCGFNSEHG